MKRLLIFGGLLALLGLAVRRGLRAADEFDENPDDRYQRLLDGEWA